MAKRMNMKLSDVKVLDRFREHDPKREKIERKKRDFQAGKLEYGVITTSDGVLVDGYASYLALKELGTEDITVRIRDVSYIVSAHHPAYPGKTCQWRCKPTTQNKYKPGDHIAVRTRQGVREAIIEGFSEMPADEAAGMSVMMGKWDPDYKSKTPGNGHENKNNGRDA